MNRNVLILLLGGGGLLWWLSRQKKADQIAPAGATSVILRQPQNTAKTVPQQIGIGSDSGFGIAGSGINLTLNLKGLASKLQHGWNQLTGKEATEANSPTSHTAVDPGRTATPAYNPDIPPETGPYTPQDLIYQ